MRTLRVLAAASLMVAVLPECSSEKAVAGQRVGSGGSTSSGGVGGGGSSSGGTGGTGGTLLLDAGSFSDVVSLDSACAGDSYQAEQVPLAMYVLLDSTGSMLDQGKWAAAIDALNAFVNDPASAGIRVAIQSFSGEGPCDGTVYDTPAVDMQALPTHATKIGQWLAGIFPDGQTPTEGALRGLTQFAADYASVSPDEKVIGLLVTDGVPTRCDTSPATLTGLASAAFGGQPSIQIFTMGMAGADFTLLDQIATAGGSQSSYDASGGSQAFVAALEAIRGTALSCEFLLPDATSGSVDPDKVNVDFFPGAGGKETFFKVDDAASCVPKGWYLDDPMTPTKVILCDDTCALVKGDATGRIDLILGCASITPS